MSDRPKYPRPRTPPPDSDQPPPGETSSDGAITDPRDGFGDLTPPPHDIERLLFWATRKLPNHLSEMAEAIRHVKRAPDDHEKRIRALETQRLDLELDALTGRVGKLETDNGTQSGRRWQIVLMLIGQVVTFVAGILIGKKG